MKKTSGFISAVLFLLALFACKGGSSDERKIIFRDKRIRQAFNYAIDREKIVQYVLKGEAYAPGFYGIVPPAFKNYHATEIKGYNFNPDLARKLLAEAGYPNGKGFPAVTLQLNSGGSRNEKVAQAVQKMLMENLNVSVELKVLDWATHLENYETGKADLWRTGWVADYPEPENFLNLLHSKHIPPKLEDKAYLNAMRYNNPKFDELFDKAVATIDETERFKLYLEAERLAMEDAPIMPIYYDEDYRLLQPYVKNYPANSMEYRDFREVWLDLPELPKGKNNIRIGGIFRDNEVEEYRSLYPLNITEVSGHRIVNQIYEGLVRFAQDDLRIIPCIADKWEISPDGTVYIFYLHKGVRFHDDECFPPSTRGKGREVTANDFLWCFTKMCTKEATNQGFWIFQDRVKGANDFYNGKTDHVEGLKVMDDYTFQITLEKPFAPFMQLLTTPFTYVFPKEALDKYGLDMRVHCVGTGPFKFKSATEGQSVILVRNPNYWRKDAYGNPLPYMDAVHFSFIKEQKAELLEFKKGNLEFTYRFPTEFRTEIVNEKKEPIGEYKKFILQRTPGMSIQYYGFLIADEPSKQNAGTQ